jgi:Rps23 Pro-64 3,4-dihydroxylase Tpa1-like proline 4-hydroxylase
MSNIINTLTINANDYQALTPYPYGLQDEFLDADFAKELQHEILSLTMDKWDRYDNPFEQKYTLRDKYAFPSRLGQLFDKLQSDEFVTELSAVTGWPLKLDTTRNFWGVHIYKPGDYLDIHVDAGRHPTLNLKKQVTLGIYLSANWKEEYGCKLEIWRGTSAAAKDPHITEKITSIAPVYNRMILFNCNDNAWHGNPNPSSGPAESRRIFITISYLSDNSIDENHRVKAYFVSRPEDPPNPEKDALRLLRADPERYKEMYRTM